MDSKGNIYSAEEMKKFTEEFRDKTVPIEDHELPDVTAMNRKQRRAWYAQKRREMKRAKKSEP